MTRQEAIKAINDLVRAEVAVVKQCNSGSGRVSKANEKREMSAAVVIFNALTDEHPTAEEIKAMVEC